MKRKVRTPFIPIASFLPLRFMMSHLTRGTKVGLMADETGDGDDELLASLLESELVSDASDTEQVIPLILLHLPQLLGFSWGGFLLSFHKLIHRLILSIGQEDVNDEQRPIKKQRLEKGENSCAQIDTGLFSKIPPELFHHIFKFLSSEV